jgi:hypothetical protein
MLKRKIVVLIAGALLSAQAGLAVAAGPFPDGADWNQYWKPGPALEKYLAERDARTPPTGAKGPVFQSVDGDRLVASPAVEKYFAERARRDPRTMLAATVFADDCLAKYSPD